MVLVGYDQYQYLVCISMAPRNSCLASAPNKGLLLALLFESSQLMIFLESPRRSTVGCAEVLNTTRRTWLRLVGRRHDVQLWDVDTRVPTLAYKRPYTGRETGGEAWVTDVLERIRSRYVNMLGL